MNDITQFLTGFGGLAVFAAVFADQVGLPLPAPPLLLAAGALAADGKLNPVLAVGMTAIAAVLADSIWFWLGRRGRGHMLHLLSRWPVSRNAFNAHILGVAARLGLVGLTVGKFLPGTVMPSLAGALGMDLRRFLIFDGLASLSYGGSYVLAGFLFHDQVQLVMAWFNRVGHGVMGVGLVLVVAYIACKYLLRRRRNRRRSNPPDKESEPAGKHTGACRCIPCLDAANLASVE
jgi:membrane protein DedA with SNARE-associated domain